ncbi:DUF1992 domain-containing protein [Microbacterium candidum]|uniref:DUF1992 domain-containing protein n=1 Tax=Microbacterium candidum TaxID=3041922 RepID=A0ABT7N460_9MICO|nr:DUF1992 domain-containing protein [Microbacterium sp. ASV49]MDL9981492.1 DUF1992 domain-containing protein [Microbacterium sp. ASV49]
MSEDARAEARRRSERAARGRQGDAADTAEDTAAPSGRPGGMSELERAAVVETAIQQAIRRGEFDDLPGAGKPIPRLGDHHDPDWWIRRKIETEQLRGLGPAALTLRVENAELDALLDGLVRETDVRETLEDFNRRVIEARRQLQGGPPVVTPTRDVEAEVAAWTERRTARQTASRPDGQVDHADAQPRRRIRWQSRRQR